MKKAWTENNLLVVLVALLVYTLLLAIVFFGFPMNKKQQQQYVQNKMELGFSFSMTEKSIGESVAGASSCGRLSFSYNNSTYIVFHQQATTLHHQRRRYNEVTSVRRYS